MSASAPPPPSSRLPGELPPDKYSAERVTWIEAVNDHLFRFRTTRYRGFRFTPGQFARLGVYRNDGPAGPRYVWRAYSIASSSYDDFLEFYSIVVPQGEFTTRLAALQVGDEILIEKTNYGFLTTDRFPAGKQLWLLSSGTGLAPFMAILQDLEVWATYEDIVVVHSVRQPDELAYRQEIALLAQQAGPIPEAPGAIARLHYVPIVTRTPQAGVPDRPHPGRDRQRPARTGRRPRPRPDHRPGDDLRQSRDGRRRAPGLACTRFRGFAAQPSRQYGRRKLLVIAIK